MISEWWIRKVVEGSGRDTIVKNYPSICVGGLRKTMKNLSQDSRSPGRDLNPALTKYDAGVNQTTTTFDNIIEEKTC
jgi:hypothetical protein